MVPKNLTEKRDKIVQGMKKYHVFCTRIWSEKNVIIFDRKKFPNTVEATQRVINFPLQNHYTEKDVKKMITAIKKVMANLLK